MSLLNPYVILGAIITAISVYFFGHHAGWADRDAEMQSEIALKNEQSRATEQKLNEQINETSTKLQEANNVVTKKQTDINALIRAGRVRLPTTSCVQATASAPTATRDSKEEGSESDRATLEAIAAIAAEGDRAINQLNACIDAYNQVREQLNGKQ
jgi:preprotein translocase subunit SecF